MGERLRPDEVANRRAVGPRDTSMKIFCRWNPSLEACYLGFAQSARDWAFTWTDQRQQEPFPQPMSHYPQTSSGRRDRGRIRATHAMLLQTATAIAETPLSDEQPLMDIIACHHFVTKTAVQRHEQGDEDGRRRATIEC